MSDDPHGAQGAGASANPGDGGPGLPSARQTQVTRLRDAGHPNPLGGRGRRFVRARDQVLLCSTQDELAPFLERGEPPPTFEQAGPRELLAFRAEEIACGIVTCGGLCPGVNDVIRAIVMTLRYGYGVQRIHGFRYGYAGLAGVNGFEPMELTPKVVEDIHTKGGTLLGSSRGPQELDAMVENLRKYDVRILFTIGGDGTLRGASALVGEIRRRGLEIAIVGIPKTIDNDLLWVERSFGFNTAVEEAMRALTAAHEEARGAYNGIGLVKLMGRHAGFITAHATLANSDVNFCLVPEVPFTLQGRGGFLRALEQRLQARRHAVIAVAEGAGQELIPSAIDEERDASGNLRLKDVGGFLRGAIERDFALRGEEITLKYIDPSYTIRSLPANAVDSEYCLALGQHAVHAGMAGRTDMMVGFWNRHYVHVPLDLVTHDTKKIDPNDELWRRVLDATGQPGSLEDPAGRP